MINMLKLIGTHPAMAALIAFWIFSNLVGLMHTPQATSGKLYRRIFTLLHVLSAGLPRLLATMLPQYAGFLMSSAPPGGSDALDKA